MKPEVLTPNEATPPKASTCCHHCGDPCPPEAIIVVNDLSFCCNGCELVYTLLHENDLAQYYSVENRPGISARQRGASDYSFLEDADIEAQLLDYQDENRHQLRLHLPQIHCSACVWLLENIYRLLPGIISSRVNILERVANIAYDPKQLTIRELVEMLARIGYAPALQLNQLEEEESSPTDRSVYYKLGLAGFAFGNIMLFSFPEYLGLQEGSFTRLFGYLNLAVSLPVLFYSASDYWQSAFWGLRQRHLNIDIPITLGMLALFSRSAYEILTHTGAGYLDSLAGLVFFLLVGKWFQQRTYRHLSFERDYKSYFPIAVMVKTEEGTTSRPLSKVQSGDILVIRNEEMIPVDGTLLKGRASLDYSFVTGESETVHRAIGDTIFAGGRQQGGMIELLATRTVRQSYLTQLWNDSAFEAEASTTTRLSDWVGGWFTVLILSVALLSLLLWLPTDIGKAINAFSAVLIIACPCAIALSIPFTYGNMLRWLGKNAFFLKNTQVIEGLQNVDTIVFDKTGTLTDRSALEASFLGTPLTSYGQSLVQCLASHSTHPLSAQLAQQLPPDDSLVLTHFEEVAGLGIRADINGHTVRIGALAFMTEKPASTPPQTHSFVEIDGETKGAFLFQQQLRQGMADMLSFVGNKYDVYLLSGDQDHEAERYQAYFPAGHLRFKQQPQDKLNFIKGLQKKGAQVLMIGDGLNDAGALQQANVGVVVSDDTNNFSPACDGILEGSQLEQLPQLLRYAKQGRNIVFAAYGLALLYNIIGLSFAVQAQLSPVIAAILMPLSSVTIVAFGVLVSSLVNHKVTNVTTLGDKGQ